MDGAIKRPDAPQHFMVLKPIARRVVVRLPAGAVLSETKNAVRVMEGGKTLFDPVVYIPAADIKVPFIREEKTTHCPLKGDASYYTFEVEGETLSELAWCYEKPLQFSTEIAGLVAFRADRVVLEEHPD